MSIAYVGIDLHKRTSQIAVLHETGEVTQHRLPNDPQVIQDFFAHVPTPAHIAIEATGTWWWLVDLLEALGHTVSLSHPKQTRAIAAARLKNDRVDAERLALLLRGGLLPTVWIPPQSVREARELLRHRLLLVQTRTRVKNHLLALLARRNLRPTQTRNWLTQHGERELDTLPLPAAPARVVENCRALVREFDARSRALDTMLTAHFGQTPAVQRLQTIPGIGPFIATALVIELGEIARFPSAKHLVSYVGLAPRVRASGDVLRVGHISKEGNPILRWVLVVAATNAARQPGPLRASCRQIAARRGRAIARVALARRLLEWVYHVWKEDKDYATLRKTLAVQG